MLVFKRMTALAVAICGLLADLGEASAQLGQPFNWQMNLQQSATPVMDEIVTFHTILLWVIALITAFVLVLLAIIAVRFNAKSNPTPSRTTHNAGLEIAWTVVPVIILVLIAIPSFRLLFFQLNMPPADLTVKATGRQWYWTYNYVDNGKFEFDSVIVRDQAKLRPDQPRLLGVDNEMVVPVNKTVRVVTTGFEVIHAFAVPAFGIKIDAIPGRVNETWFKATREGIYYGQCSELCGKDHAFMPIEIHVVSADKFRAWAAQAASDLPGAYKTLAAAGDDKNERLAAR